MTNQNLPSFKTEMDEGPTFNNYRVQNDVHMVPDKGFTKQLHALDPELEVVWDWGACKWEIWRFPKDGKAPFHMITVKTDKGDYRELGADVLLKLQEFDPWRYDSLNQLVNYFDILDEQAQRRRRKDFLNRIHDISSFVDHKLRRVLQIQVPKVLQDSAIMIDVKPESIETSLKIDLPREVRVRRIINETN